MMSVFDDIRETVEGCAEPVTIEEITRRRTLVASQQLRQRHWNFAAAAIPVAAIVAVAGVLTVQRGSVSRPSIVSSTGVLDGISKVADTQVPLQPGPGQYVYVDRSGFHFEPGGYGTGGSSPPSFWVSFHYQVRSWDSTTVNGQTVQRVGAASPAGPSDEAAWEAAGRPPLAGPTTRTAMSQQPDAGNELGDIDLATLSSAPDQLAQQLQRAASQQNAAEPNLPSGQSATVWSLAEELLSTWQLQPAVRSAVFQVLSTQPGVTIQAGARNHAGHAGTGISAIQDGIQMQIIVDPSTSEEIGYSSVIVDPTEAGYPANAFGLAGWVVIAPPIIVDSLGATS
jgi:hypothetical protein